MIRVLIQHSSHVFSQLPAVNKPSMPKNRKEQLLEQLPERFTRMDIIELAKGLSINERTAYTYISLFCDKGLIVREQQGVYSKAENG